MITRRVTIKYRSELERPVSWVALVGFMGSGKSRIGAELSRKLHLNFIDTDRVVERVSCLSIPDIFELYGETTFRDYETEIVRRSCRLDDAIVSTGGGTVVRPQNREALKKRGPVVLLTASAETTFQRTRRHKRPLLEVGNPIERINDLMAARRGFYEDVASFSVSTDGRPSTEVVEEIIEKLYQWQQEQAQLRMLQEAGYCVQASPNQQDAQPQSQARSQAQAQAGVGTVNGVSHAVVQTNVVYIKTQRLETQHLTPQYSEAQHVKPQNLETQHLETQNLGTQNLEAQNLEAQILEAQNVETQHLPPLHSESQVLSHQPQQVVTEENTLNNNQQSDGAFTDMYLTEAMESEDCIDSEEGAVQPGLNAESQQQSEHNANNNVEEKPSRDIYAEMIRDLMRDPRA